MKVDIVYPMVNRSKFQEDWELRYSLRTLAEQDWVNRIIVVGYRPTWLKDVVHISCGDPFPAKDANIIHKILRVIEQVKDLTDDFVINSDDHYILQPIPLNGLGPFLEAYQDRTLKGIRMGVSLWYRRLGETLEWLGKNQYPQWIMEAHMPYLVNKGLYLQAMNRLPWKRKNAVVTHAYFNVTLGETPAQAQKALVWRCKGPAPEEQISIRMGEATFFNHNDQGLNEEVKRWMEKQFPNPSFWES